MMSTIVQTTIGDDHDANLGITEKQESHNKKNTSHSKLNISP